MSAPGGSRGGNDYTELKFNVNFLHFKAKMSLNFELLNI